MVRKIVRPVFAGLGAAGALFLLNRGLSSGLPVNHLEGVQRRWTWRGHEIFAVEAGEGSPVLLVHGVYAGASSYEFRKVFPLLAQRHRVIAFDFLGCGLSDKPKIDYTAQVFVEQIVAALAQLAGGAAATVGSWLGAAFAIRAAATAPNVSALAAICPTGVAGVLDGREPSARQALAPLMRTPLIGEAFYNSLLTRPSIQWFLENRVYARDVAPEVVDHYYAVAHQPGARWVPAALMAGKLDCDAVVDLPFVDAPLLIVWGDRAPAINPARNAGEHAALSKRAEIASFAESGMLPHEEEPGAVAERIERFLAAAV